MFILWPYHHPDQWKFILCVVRVAKAVVVLNVLLRFLWAGGRKQGKGTWCCMDMVPAPFLPQGGGCTPGVWDGRCSTAGHCHHSRHLPTACPPVASADSANILSCFILPCEWQKPLGSWDLAVVMEGLPAGWAKYTQHGLKFPGGCSWLFSLSIPPFSAHKRRCSVGGFPNVRRGLLSAWLRDGVSVVGCPCCRGDPGGQWAPGPQLATGGGDPVGAGSGSRCFQQDWCPAGAQLLFMLSGNSHGSLQRSALVGPESRGDLSPRAPRSCQHMGGFPSCWWPPKPVCSGTPVLEEDATNHIHLPGCHQRVSRESPRAQARAFSPPVPVLTHRLRALDDQAVVSCSLLATQPHCVYLPGVQLCLPQTHLPAVCVPMLQWVQAAQQLQRSCVVNEEVYSKNRKSGASLRKKKKVIIVLFQKLCLWEQLSAKAE